MLAIEILMLASSKSVFDEPALTSSSACSFSAILQCLGTHNRVTLALSASLFSVALHIRTKSDLILCDASPKETTFLSKQGFTGAEDDKLQLL